MVEAWWPDAQFPLELSVATCVGGEARGGVLQGVLRRYGIKGGPRYLLSLSSRLPLAVGDTIKCYKRADPAATCIELHATGPPAHSGGGGGGGGSRSDGGGGSGGGGTNVGGRPADPAHHLQASPATPQPAQQPRRAQQPAPEQQREAVQTQAPALAAAGALPMKAAADASGNARGGTASDGRPGQPLDGALVALRLRRIPVPPAGDEAQATDAGTAAFEVLRAATALQLPEAQVDGVLAALEDELGGGSARMCVFVGASYRRLQLACAAGNAAAACSWMERIAARGGG